MNKLQSKKKIIGHFFIKKLEEANLQTGEQTKP